jgi:hypothetical protein
MSVGVALLCAIMACVAGMMGSATGAGMWAMAGLMWLFTAWLSRA